MPRSTTRKSTIPYIAPTSTSPETLTWVMGDGMSIVRSPKETFVSLTSRGEEVATLTLFQALTQGEIAYAKAETDSEKNWARALCSAASFDSA